MYERFTDGARAVMQRANLEALRFQHEYIGTEHILLGLVKDNLGAAVLEELNVDPQRIRLDVEKVIQAGPEPVRIASGLLPQTPRAKKVIEYAIDESRMLRDTYIGTEHLLLGLIREGEGVAGITLAQHMVTTESTRAALAQLRSSQMPLEVRVSSEALSPSGRQSGFLILPSQQIRETLDRFRVFLGLNSIAETVGVILNTHLYMEEEIDVRFVLLPKDGKLPVASS